MRWGQRRNHGRASGAAAGETEAEFAPQQRSTTLLSTMLEERSVTSVIHHHEHILWTEELPATAPIHSK